MKLAAVPSAMATMLAALLLLAPVLVGCSSTSQGTYTSADGTTTYTGEFKDGKFNGQGTMTYPNGNTYTGAFKDGLPIGQGTITYPDGTKRTGEWKDGKLVP